MLIDTKQCKNKKCIRNGVLFEPPANQKYCLVCGSKLRYWDGEDDRPALTGFVHGGPATPKADAPFVGESDCDVSGCPVAPDAPKVEIPYPLYNKWVFLAHNQDVEWIAYLKGHFEGGRYLLLEDGMYFPLQKATGTHVEAADNSVEEEGTIAAIHSHVDMTAFFSKEDENHFNHAVELVVNRKGDLGAMVRVKLECGRFQRVKATCILTDAADAVAINAELETKLTIIKEHAVVSTGSSTQGWKGGRKGRITDSDYGTILDT